MNDWLPITTRNRVALLLAFAGLVMFVVWNWVIFLMLMSLGMFAISASLFLFKNELALREERNRPVAE